MKKWMCLLLAAMLFAPALAEDFEPTEYVEEGEYLEYEDYEDYEDSEDYEEEEREPAEIGEAQQLEMEEEYSIDLDGDGVEEIVRASMEEDMETGNLSLTVQTEEKVYSYECDVIYSEAAYVVDLDGDGKMEILLTGDEASEDYFTWCLKFSAGEGFQPIQFADANRGENTDGYFDCGYGEIRVIDGNVLTLVGSQDALGTWMCSRQFTLRDGRFELDDDGVWHVAEDLTDPDLWEYRSLIAVQPVPVTLEDGSSSELPAGTSLVVIATDKVSFVDYQTKEGDTGRISVSPNVDDWGFLIDGKPEADYFEYIPYAD